MTNFKMINLSGTLLSSVKITRQMGLLLPVQNYTSNVFAVKSLSTFTQKNVKYFIYHFSYIFFLHDVSMSIPLVDRTLASIEPSLFRFPSPFALPYLL